MKKSLLIALTLLLAAPAFAARVHIPGTSVSFVPPAGFTTLTPTEMRIKYPIKNAPDFAIGNAHRTTSIAFEIKPIPFSDAQIEQEFAYLVPFLQSNGPGIKWVDKKVISFDGQRWIYLEFTSTAVDADIHNIIFVTPFDGKMLIFNFNSTKQQFPLLEKQLRASLQSIRLTKVTQGAP